jgi:hypothetical protein
MRLSRRRRGRRQGARDKGREPWYMSQRLHLTWGGLKLWMFSSKPSILHSEWIVADGPSQVKAKIKRTKAQHYSSRDMHKGSLAKVKVVVRIMRRMTLVLAYRSAEAGS